MIYASLADVADINPRLTTRPAADEAVAFLGMADVDAVAGKTTAGERRPFAAVAKGYTPFLDGDLLVAKITPCFENGKIAQARLGLPLGMGSTEFHVVRPRPDALDPRYALHLLRIPAVRAAGERRMTGSAGQRRVPTEFLRTLSIPLPHVDEQRRIADILDRAGALTVQRRRTIALLEELSRAVFDTMFGPGGCDAGGETAPLAEVVDPGTIVTYGIVQAGPDYDGGVPYIKTGDIANGLIDKSALALTDPAIAARFNRSRVRTGDIVISIRATVGTTALVTPELAGANLTQGTARISPGPSTHPIYLLNYLRSAAVQHWIGRQIKGATFREITLARLRELPVAVPSRESQELFAERLSSISTRMSHTQSSLSTLERLCNAVQHRAFRGEL